MATNGKAEDSTSGISVDEKGHAEIHESISELPRQALMKCHALTEVSLPPSVKFIGEHCFGRCSSLKTARIPNSVEVIGKGAFFYCTNLKEVTIGQDQPRLRVIGEQAFAACRALKVIEAPESVTEILPKAFHACLDLLNATIHGHNLSTLQEEVFSGCSSLEAAILPSSVTCIEKMAFQGCRKLRTIRQCGQQEAPAASTNGVFLSSVTSVGERSFENCKSLESVVPSETLRIIDFAAFKGCENLKDFQFPEGLELIEHEAFSRCSSLEFARLPPSLVRIGRQAFESCSNLQSVIMPPTEFSRLESIGQRAFGTCVSLCIISFPNGAEVQTNALEGCERLQELVCQNLQDPFDYEFESFLPPVKPLTSRFDRLPLLRLCYHQSYYPSQELRARCSNLEMAGGASKVDCCGMTVLHLLALSRCSNLDVWNYLMEENPSNIMAMDSRGHLPLGYLLLQYCCESAILDVYFAAGHKSFPFRSSLDYIVRNTLP